MTVNELQIQLDISSGNESDVLNKYARETRYGYIFVDSLNGQCYLLDEHGKIDDIRKVKNIGDWAFSNYTSIKSIIIPDSVESIGSYTFAYCTSLKHITIPGSVKSIGDGAFAGCTSLESITIPDSVRSIGDDAFYHCKFLKSIIIPDSVESIGYWAFKGCASLNEVIFKGKTIDQIEAMDNYHWGIKDRSIIKCQIS